MIHYEDVSKSKAALNIILIFNSNMKLFLVTCIEKIHQKAVRMSRNLECFVVACCFCFCESVRSDKTSICSN